MAVAFLLFFCRFVLVSIAFCLFLAVPLVRFSTLFSPLWCFFIVGVGFGVGWGGFGGGVITSRRVRFTWLRCFDAKLWTFLRSWCYVVNFPPRTADALDAALWTFFLELQTLLMLRCELSSWNFRRSWCYVVNFLPRTSDALDATLVNFLPGNSDALDATLWTFFLELQTLLMLRCELSS